MGYLTLDQMDERDRLYDLTRVRAARPAGPGECGQCLRWARARFPVLFNCLNRVSVDLCCANCAMQPPAPDLARWCCEIVSRARAERILAPVFGDECKHAAEGEARSEVNPSSHILPKGEG